MKLYDGTSPIEWESGTKTVEEMREEPELEQLLSEPSVLIDNGDVVVDWMLLSAMCAMHEVPQTGNAETDYEALVDAMNSPKKEQYATDPQLQALATMQVAAMDLTEATSTDCAGFRDYWPEWKPDTEYKYQQPLRHKGLYYRASKALTSSAIYPPDTAGESEYYPVEIAPDGIIVYRECHGQYDQVQAGETRHYPDAEGPVYRAKVDTAYDPDTVPDNWELV